MKTLFEEISEELKLESGRTAFFYRRAYTRLVSKYLSDPTKILREERSDNSEEEESRDKNLLRNTPRAGHLMMFEYKPSSKNIKQFDRNPLVYMISASGDSFTGCNLHYIEPRRRQIVVENLMKGRLMLPLNSINKYSIKQVKSLFLDIAISEWNTVSNLPLEYVTSIENGKETEILISDVWRETNKTFRDMLRGTRIYKGYGKHDSDFRGEF